MRHLEQLSFNAKCGNACLVDSIKQRAHDTKTLIRFDLGLFNLSSASVGCATINLYALPGLPPLESPSTEHPVTTDLFQVLNPWSESTVTWETAPMTGAMPASSSSSMSCQRFG